MLKRVLIFIVFIALVGAVSSLVYFNVRPMPMILA